MARCGEVCGGGSCLVVPFTQRDELTGKRQSTTTFLLADMTGSPAFLPLHFLLPSRLDIHVTHAWFVFVALRSCHLLSAQKGSILKKFTPPTISSPELWTCAVCLCFCVASFVTSFQEWDRRGKPGGSFFTWLSTPEVQLDGCPRHELESDVVHYCRPEERDNYALSLKVTEEVCTGSCARFVCSRGDRFNASNLKVSTRAGG